MIVVSKSRPKLYFNRGGNDMSHYHPSGWSVGDYFYMSLNDYMEKRDFEHFDMKPGLDKKEMDILVKRALDKDSKPIEQIEAMMSPGLSWAYHLNLQMKKSKGMLWQFNAVNKDLDGLIRNIAVLGEKTLNRWTWFDINVKLPVLHFTCNILNRLRVHKVNKEIKEWDEFLKEVHSDK